MNDLREQLRSSIEQIEASTDLDHGLRLVKDRPPAATTATTSNNRWFPVAAAITMVALLGAGAAWMAASRNSGPPTSAYAQEQQSSEPDVYDQALARLDGRSALPVVEPPGLSNVILSVGNGQQVLRLQLDRMMILVCGPTPCGEHTSELRSVTVDGTEFRVLAAPLSKTAVEPPEVTPEERSFWESAEFTTTRPDWLTVDLFPGAPGD